MSSSFRKKFVCLSSQHTAPSRLRIGEPESLNLDIGLEAPRAAAANGANARPTVAEERICPTAPLSARLPVPLPTRPPESL